MTIAMLKRALVEIYNICEKRMKTVNNPCEDCPFEGDYCAISDEPQYWDVAKIAADAAEDETKTSARIQHLIGLLYAVSCCEGAQITINKKLCEWAAATAEALKDVETNRQDTERE